MPPERRAPPRFVPTLTAVVEPQTQTPLASASVAQPPQAGVSAPPSTDELRPLMQAVMSRLDAAIAQSLQGRVEQLVAEQSAMLARRVRADIEPLVRDIVAAELARGSSHEGR